MWLRDYAKKEKRGLEIKISSIEIEREERKEESKEEKKEENKEEKKEENKEEKSMVSVEKLRLSKLQNILEHEESESSEESLGSRKLLKKSRGFHVSVKGRRKTLAEPASEARIREEETEIVNTAGVVDTSSGERVQITVEELSKGKKSLGKARRFTFNSTKIQETSSEESPLSPRSRVVASKKNPQMAIVDAVLREDFEELREALNSKKFQKYIDFPDELGEHKKFFQFALSQIFVIAENLFFWQVRMHS